MLKPHILLRDWPPVIDSCESAKMAPPLPSSPAQTFISLFVISPAQGQMRALHRYPCRIWRRREDPGRHICHAWPANFNDVRTIQFYHGRFVWLLLNLIDLCLLKTDTQALIEHAAVVLYLFTPVFSSSSASSHRRSFLSFPSGPLYIGTAFDPIMSPNSPSLL